MKVSLEQNNPNIQAEKRVSVQSPKEMPKPSGTVSGISVDLFSDNADGDAYKGVPKNKEDIVNDASFMDVKTNSDYRIVMSNCMSDEDFSKLLKDGTHPGNTEIETVVTIVDTIKAEMAKSGNVVTGYNDDLDRETLIEITGSETFANKLAAGFDKKNIPLTKENARMAKEVYDRVSEIGSLSEDATKYMIENNLEPTADNLYMASFSVKAGNGRQGKGYFANDMHGYYSQKAEVFNWGNLQPQMEKVIESAGFEVSDETLMDSMWIIKNGIPFTVDTFSSYEQIKNVNLSAKETQIYDAIATAIADGKPAKEAVFSETQTLLEKAVAIQNTLEEVTDWAVDLCVENAQPLNLKNLAFWQKKIDASINDYKENAEILPVGEKAKDRLLLEEVRLQMSVEANYKLLKSGYQIDVAELTDLVANLKEVNAERNQILYGTADARLADSRKNLYNETVEKVSKIPQMPAAAIASFTLGHKEFTLNNVYEAGSALAETYAKANRSYEALMTAPRSDLGDSIKKAFRNVDDILADMEYAINEENRKAVRTLGYNNIPLTDENIQKVVAANRQVTNVLDKLTPAAILKMIRDGQNPLEMQMQEVENYLVKNAEALEGTETEKFSSYLYQLEQNKAISEDERAAFMGVCRLIHQIQKSDGGAVGSLVNSGAEITFKNLLSAVRSKNKGHINTVIDADTGLNEGKMEYFNSISAQIERAFKGQLKTLAGYEETQAKYEHNMLSDIQNLAKVSDNIISQLLQNDLPITPDNLFAANALMNMEYSLYGAIGRKLKNSQPNPTSDKNEAFSEYKEACRDLQESFGSEDEATLGIEQFTKKVQDLLTSDTMEENAKAIDVKELSLLHKQVGLVKNFASNKEYQVPVFIDDNYVTIHLTLLQDEGSAGSVNASMETEKYGTVGGRFTENNSLVEGYLVCENGFDTQTKDMFTGSFLSALDKESLKANRLSFVQSGDVDAKKFGPKADGKHVSETKTDTKTLYAIAKAFIKAVQDAM